MKILMIIYNWIVSLFKRTAPVEVIYDVPEETTGDVVEENIIEENIIEDKIISETYMKNLTIILDAGHGKETPGKRSPKMNDGRQLIEWEYTRRLSKSLKEALDELGIRCIQSNIDDTDPGLTTRANNINKIVRQESEIGNSCLMISLHGNAAANGGWAKAQGWEVWSTVGTTKSDRFANILCEVFPQVFPDRKLRGHKEKNFTVIYKTACPCVLTENFFYDNEDECNFMLSDECISRLTQLHVEAIKRYME